MQQHLASTAANLTIATEFVVLLKTTAGTFKHNCSYISQQLQHLITAATTLQKPQRQHLTTDAPTSNNHSATPVGSAVSYHRGSIRQLPRYNETITATKSTKCRGNISQPPRQHRATAAATSVSCVISDLCRNDDQPLQQHLTNLQEQE